MRFYARLERVFPNSFPLKVFLVAFLGTHVPLIAAVTYELYHSDGIWAHLDLMALRDDHVVGATARAVDYLKSKKSSISTAYDRALAETSGMEPWQAHLDDWRAGRARYRQVDLAALAKYATALCRTFPDRPSTLVYLYWEPLDAASYDDFRHHRHELATLAAAVEGARVDLVTQSFETLWRSWLDRGAPDWLSDHVERLRSRYAVSLGAAN